MTSALKFVSLIACVQSLFYYYFCNNCTREGDEHFDLNKLLGQALLRRDSRVTKTNKRTILSPKVSKLRRQLWTGKEACVTEWLTPRTPDLEVRVPASPVALFP